MVVFVARAEARAMLVAAGEMEMHEAVDGLYLAAIMYGLDEDLGEDAVQTIMAEAFHRYVPDIEEPADMVPDHLPIEHEDEPEPRRDVAPSTLDAVDFLVRENDPERLRRFLDGRPDRELAAIEDHLRKRAAE
jgi:hypothetical protein